MDFQEYQNLALRSASPEYTRSADVQIVGSALGLAGESGEFADRVKKIVFQGHSFDHSKSAEEIGDILWYCALAADAVGYPLELIAEQNIQKLRLRYPEKFTVEQSLNRPNG